MEETTIDRPTTMSVGLKYGLIAAIVTILMSVITAIAGQNPYESKFDWRFFVGLAISLTILVLAHKEYKDKGDGYMSYSKGLAIGMVVGVVSGLLYMLFTFVYLNFVDPGLMDQLVDKALDDMAAQNQPDNAMDFTKKYFSAFFWGGMIFVILIGSLIYSLIVSIFTQKTNPNPEF